MYVSNPISTMLDDQIDFAGAQSRRNYDYTNFMSKLRRDSAGTSISKEQLSTLSPNASPFNSRMTTSIQYE